VPAAARRRLSVVLAAIAVVDLALIVGALAWSGGLRTAPAEKAPLVRLGEGIDTGRFVLTPRRAWTTSTDPLNGTEFAETGRFLTLEMDVRVTADESVDNPRDLQRGLVLRLPGGVTIDGTSPRSNELRRGAVLALDHSPAQVHPGLPRRVLAVYELPPRQPWPRRVEVSGMRWEYAPGFLVRSRAWRVADTAVGRVVVPVKRGGP
jgi:hypothetical protein